MAEKKRSGSSKAQRGPVRPAIIWLIIFIGIMLAIQMQKLQDRDTVSVT